MLSVYKEQRIQYVKNAVRWKYGLNISVLAIFSRFS